MQIHYIRYEHFLYTLRIRERIIVSIQRSRENNREPEYLTWDDLDEELQDKITRLIEGREEEWLSKTNIR